MSNMKGIIKRQYDIVPKDNLLIGCRVVLTVDIDNIFLCRWRCHGAFDDSTEGLDFVSGCVVCLCHFFVVRL